MRANDMNAEDHAELVKKRDKMKMPKYYFSYNDETPSEELADCIITECESAGLIIEADEDLAKKRGYDNLLEVTNPYKDKLQQVLKICKANAVYDWDSNTVFFKGHTVQDEFKEIIKIIKDK